MNKKKHKTLIIAEAGVNHNGDLFKAKKLIDAAKISRADVVKFQTFDPDKLVTKSLLITTSIGLVQTPLHNTCRTSKIIKSMFKTLTKI